MPRMPKGALLVFDELDNPMWPGETLAALESVGLGGWRCADSSGTRIFRTPSWTDRRAIRSAHFRPHSCSECCRAGLARSRSSTTAARSPRRKASTSRCCRDVIRRGAFIQQRDLADFEAHLAEYLGVKHAIGVGNATDGLIMAFRAAGIGPGDEVIFPSHTMVASPRIGGALRRDVPFPWTWGHDHLIDPEAIEAAVTPRTRAILPVHLNGRTCDMDPIQEIARASRPADHRGCGAGARLEVQGPAAPARSASPAAFSFYPAKILGCFGDGGAVVTNDDEVARRIRLLRDHGRNDEGRRRDVGTQLAPRQPPGRGARLPVRELRRRSSSTGGRSPRSYDSRARRRSAARASAGTGRGSRPLRRLSELRDAKPTIATGCARTSSRTGIGTLIQWGGKAVHQFTKLGFTQRLPRTERFFERCLMLPMNMMVTEDDARYIAARIRHVLRRVSAVDSGRVDAAPAAAPRDRHHRAGRANPATRTADDVRGGSSHIGSVLSMADIVAVLYGAVLRVDPADPAWPDRDRFILSKGHAGAGVYAALAERGFFPVETLDDALSATAPISAATSPTRAFPASSSRPARSATDSPSARAWRTARSSTGAHTASFVLLSDGECDEGSNWEAILFAAHHRLSQPRRRSSTTTRSRALKPVAETLALEPFADKWRAFGWAVVEVDGHDHDAAARGVRDAPRDVGQARRASSRTRSRAKACRSWSIRCSGTTARRAATSSTRPRGTRAARLHERRVHREPHRAGRDAIRASFSSRAISASACSTTSRKRIPDQFLNAGVAEQNMTGLATGLALDGRIVFTYSIGELPDAALPRADPQRRRYHDANVKVVAVGGGFSYGALGMSHHATEDLAIMRSASRRDRRGPRRRLGDGVCGAGARRASRDDVPASRSELGGTHAARGREVRARDARAGFARGPTRRSSPPAGFWA